MQCDDAPFNSAVDRRGFGTSNAANCNVDDAPNQLLLSMGGTSRARTSLARTSRLSSSTAMRNCAARPPGSRRCIRSLSVFNASIVTEAGPEPILSLTFPSRSDNVSFSDEPLINSCRESNSSDIVGWRTDRNASNGPPAYFGWNALLTG